MNYTDARSWNSAARASSLRPGNCLRRALLKKVLVGMAFMLALLHVQRVNAFKPRTHVWIAQEVLNDVLFDGKVTINGREYAVPQRTLDALRAHESEYRMGHIGPDAFPDILVGQTVVHPGRANGWQTDDWLLWSLQQAGSESKDFAYALGMLGHAAGDVFAHSYVNMYAGDIFSFMDGETDVELRHIALESFIDKYTPPLRNRQNVNLGGVQDNISAPSGFLARHLILEGDPAREYQASRMGTHLVAMRSVFMAVSKARATAGKTTEGVQSLIIDLENKGIELGRQANDLVGPIAQAKLNLKIATEAFNQHDKLIDAQKGIIGKQKQVIREAERTIADAGGLMSQLPGQIAHLQNRIVDVQRDIALTPTKVTKKVCREVTRRLPWPLSDVIELVCDVVQVANPAYEKLVDSASGLIRQKNNLEASLQQATIRHGSAVAAKAAATAAIGAADVEIARLEAIKQADNTGRAAIDQAKAALEVLERTQKGLLDEAVALKNKVDGYRLLIATDLNPVALALKHWEDDIKKAIEAYEKANYEVMLAVLRSENALAPLQEWMNCWAPVFMAVPSQIPGAVCIAKHGIEEIRELRGKLRKALGPGGWLVDPAGMTEEILLKELTPALQAASIQVASLINGNLGEIVKMHLRGINDAQLDAIFSKDGTSKNLLFIPDVSKRLLSDMQVRDGVFDAEKFAPVYNAVVLAKLSLLEGPALNEVATNLGISFPTTYGASLYDATPTTNVLLGVVRSIDGNHQWQAYAPSYPRRKGTGDGLKNENRRYGYSLADGPAKGMRYYAYSKSDSRAFAQLFKGPLSPALETPKPLGFSPVLPRWYVAGTAKDPFPATPPDGFWSRLFRGIFG